MGSIQTQHSRVWQVIAGVLLLLVFWLDTAFASRGLGIPVLYVIPTILFVGGSTFAEPLIIAAVATVLTAAGFFSMADDAGRLTEAMNRSIAVLVIWSAAALVVAYVRLVDRWSLGMTAANDALARSMRRLQDIEHALDQSAIVAATDQTGMITYVNDKFCEISKYSREELLGQDHRLINSAHHPKDYIRDLWHTIASGQVWRGELRNRAKDGSIYWVDTTIVPFVTAQGKPWQYLAIRQDITARKAAEEQLRNEAALTQLGRLSAVVAHEVRNPLAALRGSLQVLASRLPETLSGREIIPPLIARIDSLDRTVRDILTYSKPSQPKRQRFNLASLLRDTAAAARAAAPGCVIEITGENAVVDLDPEMIRAVVLNLLLNAAQASGATPVALHTTVRDGHGEVAVLDRGPGIPAEVREHLFEPFMTTRHEGTGLGLPIARRLTHLNGGTLVLEDRPGGGTAAILTLPCVVDATGPQAARTRRETDAPARSPETGA